ncbi:hypothetical protein [Teredinibacter purpureus]|uniref:hypothetical protein n=1 Tax=Teredinibacter purpureus TaxID=2731756 RepID=UPI0013C4064A|nr:hypothetical protein [Teredinibacter purpureus]
MSSFPETEEYVLKFFRWLPVNRVRALRFLRQVRAIRYFIIMATLGLCIFIWGGSDIHVLIKSLLTSVFLVTAFLSRKISYIAARAKGFSNIPLVIEEIDNHRLSKLDHFIEGNKRLSKEPSILKMISNSKNNVFDIYHYLNGMILISDSLDMPCVPDNGDTGLTE